MKKKTTGFTLVELMVTIAVAAILLTIAVPSFRYLIANNRATTQANALFSAFSVARTEAINRGSNVTVCPKSTASASNTTCGTNTSWVNGWHVFTDTGVIGTYSGSDVVLKHWEPLPGTPVITTTEAYIGFTRDGAKNTATAGNIIFSMSQPNTTGDASRCIRVSALGMIRVHKITSTATCS
ncbi:MAG: GspH/FimT family pseudopilin [Sedimenticola sp.]